MRIFRQSKKISALECLCLCLCLCFWMLFDQSVKGQTSPVPASSSALWGTLPPGAYDVGFKVLNEKDAARRFYKNTNGGYVGSEREIKIWLWYPTRLAKASKAALANMKFADYLAAARFTAAGEKAITDAKIFSISPLLQEISAASRAKLLETETAAVLNAPYSTAKRFPVVMFGQGLYYESPLTQTILCEFLASHGLIVATTELMGASSPFVKLDAADFEAAVRDLEFVAARVKRLEAADPSMTAVAGFDMGGLVALIYAMRNPEVRAYASYDSGILAEHNLRLVKSMPDYDPLRLVVPLFQATHPVEELARFGVREDTSFLDAAVRSERLVLRFPNTRHADFTSIPMIEWTIAEQRDELSAHRRASYETAARALLAFFKSHLTNDSKSREALYASDGENALGTVKLTKEFKPADAASGVSENEFLNRLYWGGAEKASVLFRSLRAKFPNETIFREETLNQIGYNRLYRGEASEAIRIFSLNVEAYPDSANAYNSLADAYRLKGDKERAIYNYKKSLELNPANDLAKERLKQLEAGDKSK